MAVAEGLEPRTYSKTSRQVDVAETFSYIQSTNTTSPTDPLSSGLLLIVEISAWLRASVLHANVAAVGERRRYREPPSKCCIAASMLRRASNQAERLAALPWKGSRSEESSQWPCGVRNTTSPTDPPASSLLLIIAVSGWRRATMLHPGVAAIGGRGRYRETPSECCIEASMLRGASYQAARLVALPCNWRVIRGGRSEESSQWLGEPSGWPLHLEMGGSLEGGRSEESSQWLCGGRRTKKEYTDVKNRSLWNGYLNSLKLSRLLVFAQYVLFLDRSCG